MSSNRVDTKQLESGQYRLRFRLSDEAHKIVCLALAMTPYTYPGSALDGIATNYLSGNPAVAPLGIPATGSKRLLVRLWPDQYECVRTALDVAREHASTDADALYFICASFLTIETKYSKPRSTQHD